jgi:hypothetical protein
MVEASLSTFNAVAVVERATLAAEGMGTSVESLQVGCNIFETASLVFKSGNNRYQHY